MDPIIAIMAILGIGGGFAGLWWGWLAGEVEADMRRVACEFRSLSEMIDRGTAGFKELARSVDAMMISAMQFNVAMAETTLREPWRDRFAWDDPAPWAGGRSRIGERSHRRLLAVGIDDGWRPSLDPDGGSKEGHAGELPVDLPADAEKIDAPSDVPGPGAAPPETK
jgi:hypothetical protein